MSLSTPPQPVPLEIGADGVARIGGTRVTLDTVVLAFQQGSTPEEIVDSYPVLQLRDVYWVLAYYLSNVDEVESYMSERAELMGAIRAANEMRFDTKWIRDRIASRKKAQGK